MISLAAEAREIAETHLANSLPRRWSHTIGVAGAAEWLARALTPEKVEPIVAAAWLHDIGYAPALAANGFHPIDGAAHITRTRPQWANVASLVAHHTGAAFEAHERGLGSLLASYPFPIDVQELAVLNTADLCTSPDGVLVDPQTRLNEILDRYAPQHPVHRAVAKSGPLLLAQARLVMGAAGGRPLPQPVRRHARSVELVDSTAITVTRLPPSAQVVRASHSGHRGVFQR